MALGKGNIWPINTAGKSLIKAAQSGYLSAENTANNIVVKMHSSHVFAPAKNRVNITRNTDARLFAIRPDYTQSIRDIPHPKERNARAFYLR